LMRDAIAIGKQTEIEQKLSGLAESKSDDLRLAKLIWSKANNQAIDLAELVKDVPAEAEGKATASIQRLVAADSPPLAIELEIAELALRNPDTKQLGIEFTNRLIEACMKHNKTAFLSQCRSLIHSVNVGSGKAPATQDRLKHFAEASDWDGGAILDGIPSKSIWLARNDSLTSWGHETSAMQSYLFLKYPLAGDFEIEFKARDGSYAEPGIAIGGILTEFCPYNKSIALSSIGYRHMGSVNKKFGKYKQGEWNQYRVKHSAEDFRVFINGQEAVTIPAPQSTSPFFGLGAKSYRSSSFDEMKFTGKTEIPRKVELCSTRLAGWSAYYTQQLLEPIQLMMKVEGDSQSDEGVDEDEFNQQGYHFDSDESRTFPYWYGQDNGDAAYPWVFKEGVLESADQKIARQARLDEMESKGTAIDPYVRQIFLNEPKKLRTIGLIYYQRPLCDEETIELEFYQDTSPDRVEGKSPLPISISPTIGRTAMLLDQPDISLRWLAGSGEQQWLGTDPEQRIVDPQARQLSKAQIKEKDWNAMSIRWNQGVATLSINGQSIYERRWEANVAPQFGLYHHPNQSQVKVRNVRLTGNWPETLPENLFELVQ
jgi:hypothetical protein